MTVILRIVLYIKSICEGNISVCSTRRSILDQSLPKYLHIRTHLWDKNYFLIDESIFCLSRHYLKSRSPLGTPACGSSAGKRFFCPATKEDATFFSLALSFCLLPAFPPYVSLSDSRYMRARVAATVSIAQKIRAYLYWDDEWLAYVCFFVWFVKDNDGQLPIQLKLPLTRIAVTAVTKVIRAEKERGWQMKMGLDEAQQFCRAHRRFRQFWECRHDQLATETVVNVHLILPRRLSARTRQIRIQWQPCTD